MKLNQRLMSAFLGLALLAVPITAAAHDYDNWRDQGRVPTYNGYRNEAANRGAYAPRLAANDWRWRSEGWRNGNRGNYAPASAPNCPMAAAPYAAPYNSYPNNYRQGYYPQAYNAAPGYYPQAYNGAPQYGAPAMGGRMGNMVQQRDNAEMLYGQAVRNGNRVRAKHLRNDIVGLDKNIASARTHNGYGRAYGSLNTPYASNFGNGAGYGSGNGYGAPNGLTSMMPMLGNFIH